MEIDVPFDELVPLGVLDYCVIQENFIDRELANVFLYKSMNSFDDFRLQAEEVSGIVRAKFNDFSELWLGEIETIEIKGFVINKEGDKTIIEKNVGRNKFVPHQISFYKVIIQKIKDQIK